MTKITYTTVSEHPFPADPAQASVAAAAYEALGPVIKERVEQLVDYIMKNCLWQFHSRAWDRKRQNEEILAIVTKLMCGEPYEPESPADRCYWVDAVCLVEACRSRYLWIASLSQDEMRVLMQALHARIDFLTVTGSLNEELTDQHY